MVVDFNLNNVHGMKMYGSGLPDVDILSQVYLKGLYGWDGGNVLFEQCFWYLKVCLVLMERVKVNPNAFHMWVGGGILF